MKIAIITSGYMPVPASLGGAVECLDDYLIEENEKQGKCELTILSAYEQKAERIAKTLKNTKVKFIKTPTVIKFCDLIIYHTVKFLRPHVQTMSFRYILARLHFINCAAKDLQKNDYDRVMIENHATLLMVIKKRGNCQKYTGRYIYHLHNEQKSLYGCEEVLEKAKCVATVSGYISRCIKEKVPCLKDEQVVVWRNCVDIKRFRNEDTEMLAKEKKKEYGIKEDEMVVLFTGRLSPEKGIKELLQAFELIESVNTKLVIAGGYLGGDTKVSNVYEAELKLLADKMKDRIIFTGFVSYSDIPIIYKMADIVVVPSIWNDPAPLAVIETLTCGIPLVATKSGGIIEYTNEQCAIMIERNEKMVVNIANAIDGLLRDEKLRIDMSEQSLKISCNWTISSYYEHFLDCIR